jgi:methionyl aminopeptidase
MRVSRHRRQKATGHPHGIRTADQVALHPKKGYPSLIHRKNAAEIDHIRAACAIVHEAQKELRQRIAPGVTTQQLDRIAEQLIRDHGGTPAFKGYQGFPATICASINAQIVHGIPDDTELTDGDIISVDVGVLLNGFYGDGAFTAGVGQIATEVQGLMDITRTCLDLAIEQARANNRLSDISHAVQSHAERAGMAVVRQFGGHGIGRSLHEDPHINNYGHPGRGPRLRPGFVLAIEPILSLGSPEMHTSDDGWTTTTADGLAAAHFEHTIAITEGDADILTLSTVP